MPGALALENQRVCVLEGGGGEEEGAGHFRRTVGASLLHFLPCDRAVLQFLPCDLQAEGSPQQDDTDEGSSSLTTRFTDGWERVVHEAIRSARGHE